MARIYVAEPGHTGGVGAMGMRILVDALRKDGHEVKRIRFYKQVEVTQPTLFQVETKTEEVADAAALARPDAWFISLLHVRQFWDLPDLFRRIGLPLRAERRSDSDPLVAFGGAAMIQPEPIADFADVVALGDGEATGVQIAAMLPASKVDIMRELDGAKGFWVPLRNPTGALVRLETPIRDPWIRTGPDENANNTIELARGCESKCAFCPIGWAGGTYREAPLEQLKPVMIQLAGKRVNFFAPDYSSVSYVEDLEKEIDRFGCKNTGRDARIDAAWRHVKSGIGIKSYSFGIEGMSARLREAVGKPISKEKIVDMMRALQEGGVGIVRWYMILALPGEQDADADEFLELIRETRDVYRGRLDISTTHLHGIAHTPLQWIDGHYSDDADKRVDRLVETCKAWNIAGRSEGADRGCEIYFANWTKQLTHDSDGYMYRADRSASVAIERVNSVAAKVKDGRWAEGVDVESVLSAKDPDAALPWDHVDVGANKRLMRRAWDNYQRKSGMVA